MSLLLIRSTFLWFSTAAVTAVLGLTETQAQAVGPVPGTIDTSFGTSAPVRVNFVNDGGHTVDAVATTASGKVVLAGTCQPVVANVGQARRWCLSRLNTDGSLDDTFDGPTGAGNGRVTVRITSANDKVKAVAIQPNDKIIVAGDCDSRMCIARFNVNGTFDTGFGSPNGWLYLGPQGGDSNTAVDVAVQADGKIVVGAICPRLTSPGNDQACFWRINVDGSVDTAFDAGAAGAGNGRIALQLGDEDSQLVRMTIQANGKILALGTCKPDGFASETTARFCFLRLNSNGAVDTTFSTDGRLRVAFSSSKGSIATALTVQPSGKIVAGGECSDGTNALNFFNEPTGTYFPCLLRLNSDGSFDNTFENPLDVAQSGRFLMKLDTDLSIAYPAISSVLSQTDGKTVIVFGTGRYVRGQCNRPSFEVRCGAARLNVDGSFDLLFDGKRDVDAGAGNGTAYLDRVNIFTAPVAAMQGNGRIVIAGACLVTTGATASENRLCVQQLVGGNGTQAPCNLDADGNGSVTAASDGLMMMRAMRGVINAGITTNAGVPGTAPRPTWTDIRDYLVESCGAPPERGPRIARAATLCSLDIDGDGDVRAGTDGVLLLRALLGFTGNALIGDVPFNAGATRTSAASIASFLSGRCGLSL